MWMAIYSLLPMAKNYSCQLRAPNIQTEMNGRGKLATIVRVRLKLMLHVMHGISISSIRISIIFLHIWRLTIMRGMPVCLSVPYVPSVRPFFIICRADTLWQPYLFVIHYFNLKNYNNVKIITKTLDKQ